MTEKTIRGVELMRVYPGQAGMIGLEPTSSVPASDDEYFVPIPKPFASDDLLYAWTEDALRRMDRLGIAFPVSVSLYGPIMLPSEEDVSKVVPVWYSVGFNWQGGWSILDAVVRIIDELMDGTLADEVLSHEDRRFLAYHYSSWGNKAPMHYRDAVRVRLWEGVPESELAKWDV